MKGYEKIIELMEPDCPESWGLCNKIGECAGGINMSECANCWKQALEKDYPDESEETK